MFIPKSLNEMEVWQSGQARIGNQPPLLMCTHSFVDVQ